MNNVSVKIVKDGIGWYWRASVENTPVAASETRHTTLKGACEEVAGIGNVMARASVKKLDSAYCVETSFKGMKERM